MGPDMTVAVQLIGCMLVYNIYYFARYNWYMDA